MREVVARQQVEDDDGAGRHERGGHRIAEPGSDWVRVKVPFTVGQRQRFGPEAELAVEKIRVSGALLSRQRGD